MRHHVRKGFFVRLGVEEVEEEGRKGGTRVLEIKGIIYLQKRGRTNWVLGRRPAVQCMCWGFCFSGVLEDLTIFNANDYQIEESSRSLLNWSRVDVTCLQSRDRGEHTPLDTSCSDCTVTLFQSTSLMSYRVKCENSCERKSLSLVGSSCSEHRQD